MWAKIKDGEIVKHPYSRIDLKRDYPNTGFPPVLTEELMAEYNAVKLVVDYTQIPFDKETEQLVLDEPKLVDGVWVRKFTKAPK